MDGHQLMSRFSDLLSMLRIDTQSERLGGAVFWLHSAVKHENQTHEMLSMEHLPSKVHQQRLAISRIPFSTRFPIPVSNWAR